MANINIYSDQLHATAILDPLNSFADLEIVSASEDVERHTPTYAHSLLIGACSRLLRLVLTDFSASHQYEYAHGERPVTILLPGYDLGTVQSMVSFVYRGEFEGTGAACQSLLALLKAMGLCQDSKLSITPVVVHIGVPGVKSFNQPELSMRETDTYLNETGCSSDVDDQDALSDACERETDCDQNRDRSSPDFTRTVDDSECQVVLHTWTESDLKPVILPALFNNDKEDNLPRPDSGMPINCNQIAVHQASTVIKYKKTIECDRIYHQNNVISDEIRESSLIGCFAFGDAPHNIDSSTHSPASKTCATENSDEKPVNSSQPNTDQRLTFAIVGRDYGFFRHRFYKCQNCDATFRSLHFVKDHMFTHTGEKPHACSLCEEKFQTWDSFDRHMRDLHSEPQSISCSYCGEKFASRTRYDQHEYRHTSLKKYACKACEYVTNVLTDIDSHLTVNHKIGASSVAPVQKVTAPQPRTFACNSCSDCFPRKLDLQQHRRTSHPSRTFPCVICNEKFLFSRDLRTHTSEKHWPFVCELCNERFPVAWKLRNHYGAQHAKPECRKCGRRFPTANYLIRHMKTFNHAVDLTCNVCQRSFTAAASLRRHRTVHSGELPYECHICLKRFRLKEVLTPHILEHTKDNSIICGHCRKRFATKVGLLKHLKARHMTKTNYPGPNADVDLVTKCTKGVNEKEDPLNERPCKAEEDSSKANDNSAISDVVSTEFALSTALRPYERQRYLTVKPYGCSKCKWSAVSLRLVRDHENMHTGSRPYGCDQCDKSYHSFSAAWAHSYEVHRVRKVSSCDHCSKQFSSPASMTDHENIHTGEKPYVCRNCHRSFRSRIVAGRHVKCCKYGKKPQSSTTHPSTNNIRVSCHTCHRSFYSLSALRDHMNTHTGEKPHICRECGKCFYSKTTLWAHMRSRHPKECTTVQCSVCGKVLKDHGTFQTHMKWHTGPFTQCDKCEKSFPTDASFQRHMQTHTNERPFGCATCNKSFRSRDVLSAHIRTHTGEKPHACQHCPMRFESRRDRKRHADVKHTTELL